MAEKYEKVFKIGCGTFGEAWLVNSLCSARSYVMKEVKVGDLNDDDLEKTRREAAVLARCKHINIIRYKESFLTQNPLTMCLVMEYADGGDLYEREKQSKVLKQLIPEASILHWFIQIIFAVQYLHSNNILHRDLKTQNIFLTHSNIVKVGDFGIARFLRNKQDLATTAIGTPYYLSPEICLRRPYNHRSDMWAVGCILYELCALKHPFEADDFETLVTKILHGIYSPLSTKYSKLIHELTAVLLRTNPAKRPTADDILMIPSLKLVVQDYIKRHEELISSVSVVNKGSPATPVPGSSSAGRLNGNHIEDSRTARNVENNDNSNVYVNKDHGSEERGELEGYPFTPPGCENRRDSQTQTPPEWVIKSSSEKAKNSPSLHSDVPYQVIIDKEDPKLTNITTAREDPAPSKDLTGIEYGDQMNRDSYFWRTFTVSSTQTSENNLN